jgi:hypothetical protein
MVVAGRLIHALRGLFTGVRGIGILRTSPLRFSEVRLTRILGSSLPASNPKQQQRYAVWGMCHTSQSWYAASQEQAEAQNRVPLKVGT